MKKPIDTYVRSITHDYKDIILENEYKSIADYIITEADDATGYNEYFDDDEIEDNEGFAPTDEQVEELKDYLNEKFDYLPD